jgi:porin
VLEFAHGLSDGGRLTLGAWRHSATYGSTLAGLARHAGLGAYGLIEQPLWRGGDRRLDGFIRLGVADPKTQAIASDVNVGLVLANPLLGREGEAAGLAVLRSTTGRHVRHVAGAPAPHETVIEATYRLPIGQGLSLQPDAQYVMRPGAAPGARSALVIGVRLDGAWSGGF